MTTLQNYISEVSQTNVPLLGFINWYTVSGVRVPYEDLVDHFKGTPWQDKLPSNPRNTDCFKRICSSVERKKLPTNDPKVLKNILVRQVSSPVDDLIIRRVVIEEVTPENKKLDFKQIVDVRFNRKTSAITLNPVVTNGLQYQDAAALAVASEIMSQFQIWKGCLNSYAVREWIRGQIGGLGATVVRPSGGVYFVAAEHEHYLKTLEDFIANLPGTSSFHYLPLVDTDKQRDMLKAAFESESVGEIDNLLTEISEILSEPDRKITEDTFIRMAERHQFLLGKVGDYSSLLNTSLAEVKTRLDLFQKGMDSLAPRIRVPKKKGNK